MEQLGVAILDLGVDLAALDAGLDRAEQKVAARVASMQAMLDTLHARIDSRLSVSDAAIARTEAASARASSVASPASSNVTRRETVESWGVRGPGHAGSQTNPQVVVLEASKFTSLGSRSAGIGYSSITDQQRGAGNVASSAEVAALTEQLARLNTETARRSPAAMLAMDAHRPSSSSSSSSSRTTIYNYNYGSTGAAGGGRGNGGGPPVAYGAPGAPGDNGGGGRRVDIYHHSSQEQQTAAPSKLRTVYIPGRGLMTIPAMGPNSPFSAGNLFFGNRGNGGAFGLPAFGSIGSLGGLGLEHILMTIGSLGISAGYGVAGAGLLGAATGSQMLVGGGADMLATKTTLTNVKAVYQAQGALNTAIETYGKNSLQAKTAQQQLNAVIGDLPPKAKAAEVAVASATTALVNYWHAASQPAQIQSAHMMTQFLGLGHAFVKPAAGAANTNLGIVNAGLRPLFSWLKGPQGMGVFNQLEASFAKTLPTSIHAFDMGLEDFLRLMQQASKYTGGLSHWLDNLFTRKSLESNMQYQQEVQKLVGDLRLWEALLKVLGQDMLGIFRQDQGTANSIVGSLTQMLEKLHAWETSTAGQASLQNIFLVHKQEVLQLLKVLPEFTKAYGSFYMLAAPTIVRALTTVAGAFNMLASAIESVPGGSALLGLMFVMHRLGTLAPALRGVGLALGLISKGEKGAAVATGAAAAAAGGSTVAGAETAAAGGGVLSLITKLGARSPLAGLFARGGTAAGAGLTSLLGGGMSAEAAGGLLAGGAAAIAPIAGIVAPIAIAALGAYGISKILASNTTPTNLSTHQILNTLQQHGVAGLGMPANKGTPSYINEATGQAATKGGLGVVSNTTIADLSQKQLTPVLERYLSIMQNKSAVAGMGPSQLQGMANAGAALAKKFPQYASVLDKFAAQARHDFASIAGVMRTMTDRWNIDGAHGLGMLKATFEKNMSLIANTVGLNSAEGKRLMQQNVQGMVRSLTQGMASGRISVQQGMAAMNRMLNQGLQNGGVTWRQKWTAMFTALSTAFKAHKVDAQQYSADVTSYLTHGADQVRQQVASRYAQMASDIKARFKNGTDGLVVTQQQLNAQLAALDGARNKAESAALAVWLSQLESSLKAAGQLTAAEAAKINAQLTAALKIVGPGTAGGNIGKGVGHRATGGMLVNHPMFVVGEQAPVHPEYVIASNPAYRSRNLGLWAQAGKALGVTGLAKGGLLGELKADGKHPNGALEAKTAAAIQHLVGTTGSGGRVGGLSNLLSFWQGMWGINNPLLAQSASNFIVTNAAGQSHVNHNALMRDRKDLRKEIGWVRSIIADLRLGKEYASLLTPILRAHVTADGKNVPTGLSSMLSWVSAIPAAVGGAGTRGGALGGSGGWLVQLMTLEHQLRSVNQTSIMGALKQANAANAGTGGTSAQQQTIIADQQQMIAQLGLKLAVESAQNPVLKTLPPYAGAFKTGGVVPGPAGAPRMALVHGGETITPAGGGTSSIQVVVQDGAVDPSKIRVIARDEATKVTRDISKGAMRPRPSQRAGLLTINR